MSLLATLKPKEGSTQSPKRVGRGIGSGMGGTATMGHKGQLARAGGRVRRGFEGGQTPLHRRLPKFGFSNVPFENKFEIVNLDQLSKLGGDITAEVLVQNGLAKSTKIKLLGRGDVTKALNVKLAAISEAAQKKILAAGGKVEVVK
jgi:large subunit ribosomal protein L15